MIIEKQSTSQLCEYWESIKGDNIFPSDVDIDYEYLSDIIEDCFIIEIKNEHNEQEYNFSFLGEKAQEIYKLKYQCSEEEIIESLHYMIDEVLCTKKPLAHKDEKVIDYSEINFEECLLPVGIRNRITKIIGAIKIPE